MKIVIILISAFIFFTSCKKDTKCEDVEGNLTTEELSWLSFSGGELLVFKSNANLLDSFNVGNKNSFYNLGYQQAEDPCEHHQQQIEYPIDNKTSPGSFTLSVSHHNQWNPNGNAHIRFNNTDFILSNLTPQNNILLNGVIYSDVYITTTDTTTVISPTVWRIYYTKQKGILRYDLTHGQQWEKIN